MDARHPGAAHDCRQLLFAAVVVCVIGQENVGTLVGLAHMANLRLNHMHVHDASCVH